MADMNVSRRPFTNLSEPQQIRELNRQMEWVWHQLLGGLTEKSLSKVGVVQAVRRIETTITEALQVDSIDANRITAALGEFMVTQIGVANIDLANINDLQASIGRFINAYINQANINWANIQSLSASIASIVDASIGHATIDIAQIRRVSTDTAFVREEVGGKVFIDDLAVTDANVVNLAAGSLLLNNASGDLVELYVDDQGVVRTRTVSYDGNDIINQNTLNGNRIIQNSINADRLNVSEMFALNSSIMNLIADHIDASRINVGRLKATMIELPSNVATYNDENFIVVNANKPETLSSTETVEDGWIRSSADGTDFLFEIKNAHKYAGMTGTVTVEIPLNDSNLGAQDLDYVYYFEGGDFSEDGSYYYGFGERSTPGFLPAYSSTEDAEEHGVKDPSGDVIGVVPQNDQYKTYTFSFSIPDEDWSDVFDYTKCELYSFKCSVKFTRIRNVAVKLDSRPGVRNIGGFFLDADGLTIGDFKVDSAGNVVSGASFTGNVTGNLTGNVTGNCSGTAGGVAWDNVSDKPASYPGGCTGTAGGVAWGNVTGKPNRAGSDSDGGPAQTVKGAYTLNGGKQNPNYFGVNKVGFLMMNTTVNGNSHYKDWLIMDCYSGNDVGGGVAFGVNRQALGAYIMRSAAARSSWAETAELLGTHNYTSYCPTKTGSGASGTWGINVTGSAGSVAWGNVSGKPNVATTDTAQTFTGTKSWGSGGAGGQLNGAATNGGINSIKIGDDVWLGDCNAGGIMGMKSTGSNCGFYMYNSSGTNIGQLYFNGTYLVCNKTIQASITGNAANVTGTVAVGHGGTGATTVAGAQGNLGIRRGTTSGGITVASGSYTDYAISWSALSSVPTVVVGFSTTSTAGTFGRCSVAVKSDSITKTGCTIRIFNGDTVGRNPNISWVAIG